MAQAGFSFIAVILAALTGIINNPPEDLLSLAETKQVLTELKVDQSEDSLISIIQGESQVKSDTSDLEKAVKMLREGNAKERKEARKKLGSAGEEFKDFFEKLSGDSDPEVSETAKNILKKFAAKKSAAAQTGLTSDVLKMLAIRRLTELNSSRAIPSIEKLKNDKNKDIAHEAERAYAKLKGMSVKRLSRDEGTQKLLKMLPPDAGFIAALDLTEPQKAMQLKDYLADYKNIPGMDMGMVTGMFNKSLPMVLHKAGNPQIDSIVMYTHNKLGVSPNDSWVGFIGIGRYNSDKIKKLLKDQGMAEKVANGVTYYEERWGPSICPLNDEIIILSAGERDSGHMNKLLTHIKDAENKNAKMKVTTKESRLVAEGTLTKEQKELLRKEVNQELARMQNRNGMGAEAEKAMVNLALMTTFVNYFKAEYKKEIITVACDMENEESVKKMVTAIDNADTQIRAMFKQFPFPAFKAIDLDKRFSKTEVNGKTVTLKIKGEFFNTMTMMPLMMFGMRADAIAPAAEIEVQMEDIEAVEIEAPPAVEDVAPAVEEKK